MVVVAVDSAVVAVVIFTARVVTVINVIAVTDAFIAVNVVAVVDVIVVVDVDSIVVVRISDIVMAVTLLVTVVGSNRRNR